MGVRPLTISCMIMSIIDGRAARGNFRTNEKTNLPASRFACLGKAANRNVRPPQRFSPQKKEGADIPVCPFRRILQCAARRFQRGHSPAALVATPGLISLIAN
jgi:hypothetical protein